MTLQVKRQVLHRPLPLYAEPGHARAGTQTGTGGETGTGSRTGQDHLQRPDVGTDSHEQDDAG